jgi:hypothetical protein
MTETARYPIPARPKTGRCGRIPGILAFLACLWLIDPAAASDLETEPDRTGRAELLELLDESLVQRLWEALHPDSLAPPGDYQVLMPRRPDGSGGGKGDVFLLRNGTTEGRLHREAWEEAAANSRNEKVVRWQEEWEEPGSEYIPTLWRAFRFDADRFIGWTEWPSGLRFGMGSSMSGVPAVKPQIERRIDIEWSQKLFRHFLLGAGLHRSQFGGGLVRRFEAEKPIPFGQPVDTSGPDFWSEARWGWSLSAGLPALRYTLFLADRPLPEYFWLETRASDLIREQEMGEVVNQWTDMDQLHIDGNLAQRIEARLGHLRYRLLWDGEAYASPVHAYEIDDMPSFFGRWGAGLIASSGVAATRFWFDLGDFAFSLARPAGYPTRFHMAFLHFDLGYRSLKSYTLGVSLTVRLDNPILNLPGGAP